MAVVALGGIYLAWRTYAEDHDERDLWAGITDEV